MASKKKSRPYVPPDKTILREQEASRRPSPERQRKKRAGRPMMEGQLLRLGVKRRKVRTHSKGDTARKNNTTTTGQVHTQKVQGRREMETRNTRGARFQSGRRGGGGTTANAQRHDQDMTKGLTLGLVTTPDVLRGPAHLRRRQTPTAPYVGTLSARLRVAAGGAGPLRERRWVGAPSTRPTILLAPPAAFPPPPCARSEVP